MSTYTKKKIMFVFGTRPEAIKMAPVVQSLKEKGDSWFETIVVVTGQHREQLYQALSYFNIIPDVDLNLMRESQTLTYITTSSITGLSEVIEKLQPDMVLVHGDTQAAMSGALAAFFHKVPVAHIEAGLRSYNKYSPWPEEINRRISGVIADIHFPPTIVGCNNLLHEGVERRQIFITGQTSVDASLMTYKEHYTFSEESLNNIDFKNNRIITVTAHRRENYGKPMIQMFNAIKKIIEKYPDTLLVYPVHLSPYVRETANTILSGIEGIRLIEPLIFSDMVNLMARSYLILSDSGGLQEESSVFRTPMILMRDTTERPEAIEANTVILSGTTEERIFSIANKLLSDSIAYSNMKNAINPFGDGNASFRIFNYLSYHFGFVESPTSEFIR